jgi:tRNA (uracil-5-)-methyltransferase
MPLRAIQPDRYDALLAAKVDDVRSLLAPLQPPAPQVHASAPQAFRMRAEFRIWHDGDALDYVMFDPAKPREPIAVSRFPIACERIQALMPPLLSRLRATPSLRRKLFQVEFLSTLAGDTLLTLVYHRKLDDAWEAQARLLQDELDIGIVGRSRRQKIVLRRDYVVEQLPVAGRTWRYRQYEQAFSQPNAGVNCRMIEWTLQQAESLTGNLLELYCGNGNFTLPLSSRFPRVIATELSKTAIRAARENVAENGVENVDVIRLSAGEVSAAMAGERVFRRLAHLPRPLGDYELHTVLVDPPRAGLDPATVAMVGRFPAILYISCNPRTLLDNLQQLDETHAIETLALFDQFPYTPHMECGVLLKRRPL